MHHIFLLPSFMADKMYHTFLLNSKSFLTNICWRKWRIGSVNWILMKKRVSHIIDANIPEVLVPILVHISLQFLCSSLKNLGKKHHLIILPIRENIILLILHPAILPHQCGSFRCQRFLCPPCEEGESSIPVYQEIHLCGYVVIIN